MSEITPGGEILLVGASLGFELGTCVVANMTVHKRHTLCRVRIHKLFVLLNNHSIENKKYMDSCICKCIASYWYECQCHRGLIFTLTSLARLGEVLFNSRYDFRINWDERQGTVQDRAFTAW